MTLKLYNTRTKQKGEFRPIDPNSVRMYVCGPTVYDFAHIGNARPVIVFDVLFRLLRHIYGADRVSYVRNITDVDDKINARAAEEGVAIRELTERTAAQFHADVAALGCLPPTVEPRATDHIPEMIALIEKLIERGHAYAADGHVLFHVPSDPDYGSLARRSLDEMRAGARIEIAPYKRDPMDFVLWKPSVGSPKEEEGGLPEDEESRDERINEPRWVSPWGYGRPGWHLECSAMADRWLWQEAKPHLSKQGLARPHVFDIHGGGIDLVFPHHENEVAQSTCAHGTKIMAEVWMHNGHLQVEGEKMSKSLGNFVTINELVGEWPGEAVVLAMLTTHYRQPMNWTKSLLSEAKQTLDQWYALAGDAPAGSPSEAFLAAMEDDLNTPQAIAELHRLRSEAARGDEAARAALRGSAQLIGLLGKTQREWLSWRPASFQADEKAIQQAIEARQAARIAKNWALADRIRDELAAKGIALKDSKDPATGEITTTWEIAR